MDIYRSPNNDGFIQVGSDVDRVINDSRLNDFSDISHNYRYSAFTQGDSCVYSELFNPKTIESVSGEITRRLEGVHPDNKQIIIPDRSIISVIDSYYTNGNYANTQLILMQTIMTIVNQVKTEYEMIKQNQKLSIWVTKMDGSGDLQQTSDIKLRKKGLTRGWMQYRY